MRLFSPLVCAAVLAVLAAPGCGGGTVSVSGTVTLDGQALESGQILFVPVDTSKGQSAGATIQNGKFDVQGAAPPLPGSYRVEITSKKKTGRQIPAGSPSPPGTMIDETKEAVPAKYNTNSTLRQELKPGANTLNFPLDGK